MSAIVMYQQRRRAMPLLNANEGGAEGYRVRSHVVFPGWNIRVLTGNCCHWLVQPLYHSCRCHCHPQLMPLPASPISAATSHHGCMMWKIADFGCLQSFAESGSQRQAAAPSAPRSYSLECTRAMGVPYAGGDSVQQEIRGRRWRVPTTFRFVHSPTTGRRGFGSRSRPWMDGLDAQAVEYVRH